MCILARSCPPALTLSRSPHGFCFPFRALQFFPYKPQKIRTIELDSKTIKLQIVSANLRQRVQSCGLVAVTCRLAYFLSFFFSRVFMCAWYTNSMRVNEGRSGSSLVAVKAKARAVVGKGGGGGCRVTPDLSWVYWEGVRRLRKNCVEIRDELIHVY